MMLLNFLVAFYLVRADVIRDDGYHNYEGQFTVVHKGRMLRVLMYFNHVQLEECTLHCVRHLRCKTINYHNVKKACELTDEDFDEMNADTISSGWYNHGTPPRVDGEWSSWRNFTECSKKCGNGTLEQWRDCDSPKPDHGGVDCKGRMRRTVKCNTHKCTVVNVALRKSTTQSSTRNIYSVSSKAIDGNTHTRALTNYENAWWEVDMGEAKVIRNIQLNVVVYEHNNKGLMVETRQNKDDSWIICKNLGDVEEEVTVFTCKRKLTIAQFLRIRSTKKCFLDINEVMIFGY